MIWPFKKSPKAASEPREEPAGPTVPAERAEPPAVLKPAAEPAVLTIRLDAEEVCSVRAHEVPIEIAPVVQMSRTGQALNFVNSRGVTRSYDLSSVYDEGWRFLHLCVRVGPTFAVQPDALLTKDGQNPAEAFARPDGKGIRLEPFPLPECSGNPAELVGRGLLYRGLHYHGLITQSAVSLLCMCDHCGRSFRLQSFHAGFSNLVYMYCSRALHTLAASSDLSDAPPVLGRANPESLERFERRLPACSACGGEFRYLNPLRCPHCREPYIDFPRHPHDREAEYYGNYLYGDTLQYWQPDEEPQAVA
jgi:hypothetical protein